MFTSMWRRPTSERRSHMSDDNSWNAGRPRGLESISAVDGEQPARRGAARHAGRHAANTHEGLELPAHGVDQPQQTHDQVCADPRATSSTITSRIVDTHDLPRVIPRVGYTRVPTCLPSSPASSLRVSRVTSPGGQTYPQRSPASPQRSRELSGVQVRLASRDPTSWCGHG